MCVVTLGFRMPMDANHGVHLLRESACRKRHHAATVGSPKWPLCLGTAFAAVGLSMVHLPSTRALQIRKVFATKVLTIENYGTSSHLDDSLVGPVG